MSLKSIKVVAAPAAKSKSNVLEIDTKLSLVEYNRAEADLKTAEGRVNELKPNVIAEGLKHLFSNNVDHPNDPVTSVKLIDSRGEAVRVTFQDKYKSANADIADAAFNTLGEDINDYVQETLTGSFNNAFFLKKNGEFDQDAYDAVNAALGTIATKMGKENPLTVKKVVQPKANFHTSRWSEFPTVRAQLILAEALPNTVAVASNVK